MSLDTGDMSGASFSKTVKSDGTDHKHILEINFRIYEVVVETDLAILRSRREHRVIEGVEISVQHWARVAFEEWDEVGEFSPLSQRNHSERTSSLTKSVGCDRQRKRLGNEPAESQFTER